MKMTIETIKYTESNKINLKLVYISPLVGENQPQIKCYSRGNSKFENSFFADDWEI